MHLPTCADATTQRVRGVSSWTGWIVLLKPFRKARVTLEWRLSYPLRITQYDRIMVQFGHQTHESSNKVEDWSPLKAWVLGSTVYLLQLQRKRDKCLIF